MKKLFSKLMDLYWSFDSFISYPISHDNIFIRYFMELVRWVAMLVFGIVVLALSLLLLFASGVLFALIFGTIIGYIERQFSYNIDTETCEPIGLYSNYQFNYNPLDFYNNQINTLEETRRHWTSSSIKSHCISSDDDCIKRMNRYNQEISLCLSKYKKEYRKSINVDK